MKDIDFDELDRAVSSVLGQQGPSGDGVVTSQAVSTVAEEPVKASDVVPDAQNPVQAPAAPQPAVSTTPLAIKRRGKFMDMVHPSADMTSGAPAAPVKSPRTSPVLQPLSSDVSPEVPEQNGVSLAATESTAELDESQALIGAEPVSVESLLPEHVSDADVVTDETVEAVNTEVDKEDLSNESETTADESVATEQPEQEVATESKQSLYVDPLELAAAEEQPQAEESIEATSVAVPPVTTTTDQAATPFLTDAQVDKRPLGAFGETEGATTAGEEAVATSSEPSVQTEVPVDSQASPAVPLPRELQPDVVEVESSAQEPETSPVPLTSGAKTNEPQDGRVEGHPLFDTSTYHEPITAVRGKGMPGWAKWLICLLVCLALGAGVGYFLFTAGL